MNIWLVTFVSITVILAAFVQTTSGFAFALIALELWPLVLPVAAATHLLMLSGFLVLTIVTVQHRSHINYRLVILPSIVAAAGNALGLYLVDTVPETLMIRVLGGLLIILAFTLIFSGERLRFRPTVVNASAAGAVSGVMNGMFNIPGPPMVLYYSTVTDSKEEYIATIQFFFWIALVQRIILVFLTSTISREVWLLTPFAIAGSMIGMLLGFRVFRSLSTIQVRQAVFGLMIVTGLVYLVR